MMITWAHPSIWDSSSFSSSVERERCITYHFILKQPVLQEQFQGLVEADKTKNLFFIHCFTANRAYSLTCLNYKTISSSSSFLTQQTSKSDYYIVNVEEEE